MTPIETYKCVLLESYKLQMHTDMSNRQITEQIAFTLIAGLDIGGKAMTLETASRVTGRPHAALRDDCKAFSYRRLGTHPRASLRQIRKAVNALNQEHTEKELRTAA